MGFIGFAFLRYEMSNGMDVITVIAKVRICANANA